RFHRTTGHADSEGSLGGAQCQEHPRGGNARDVARHETFAAAVTHSLCRSGSSRAPGSGLASAGLETAFFAFNTAPSTTAAGTAASSAYFIFASPGFGRFGGTTPASLELLMAFPMRISCRSYSNCLPQ